MYTYSHGTSVITIRRFNEKKTGLKLMCGVVKFDNNVMHRKCMILEADGIKQNKTSFEFASEMLYEIAFMQNSYTFSDRYWSVVLLRFITIDNRRKFNDNDYKIRHDHITQLLYEVQATLKFH